MESEHQSIAQSLIDGQPVSEYSQEEVDTIRSDLEKEKEKTIKEGNTEKLKLIQKILANIEDVSKVSQPKKKTPNLPPIKQPSNEEKEAEIKTKVESVANGDDINQIQPEEIEKAINIAKQLIKEKSEKRELLEAQKYQDLYDTLIVYRSKTKKFTKESAKLNDLDAQIKTQEELLSEAKQKRDEDLAKFKSETDAKVNEMNQQNQEKYNNFEQETEEKMPQNVSKPSPQLLDLRARANHLINTHRFAEAHNFDEEASNMEARELEAARIAFKNARAKQLQKIQHEDQNKTNIYLQKRNKTFEEKQREHNHNIHIIEKTIQNLNSQKTDKPKPKIPPVQSAKSRQFLTQHLLLPLGRRPTTAYSLGRPRSQHSFASTN